MRKLVVTICAGLFVAAAAAPARAHHAFAAEFDAKQPVKFEKAVVTKMEWTNPHTWIHVDVTDANGVVSDYDYDDLNRLIDLTVKDGEGDKLFIERNGKKEQLLPETSELFFRKGVEGRILFRHAATGKVDALIDRRNNEDVIWRKTK